MALPVTITGLSITAIPPWGPFKSSGGNYYIIGGDGTATDQVKAQKATDPTDSFTAVGTNPDLGNTLTGLAVVQVDDTLVVLYASITDGAAAIFDMATDTWGSPTAISDLDMSQNAGRVVVAVARSDGDIVVAFRSSESVMGSSRERVQYVARRSGTWDATATDVGGGVGTTDHMTHLGSCLGASDRVHIIYHDSADGTLKQRTLNSAYSLQTASTGVSQTVIAVNAGGQAVSYNDGGTIRCVLVTSDSTPNVEALYFDSGDTPSLSLATIQASITGAVRPRALVDGTDVWAVYTNTADGDVTVEKSADDGATWGSTATATSAAIQNTNINNLGYIGTIYDRGGNFVIGYLYNDNGTLKYDEYEIRAASANKTLAADSGSYAITGTATNLRHAREIVAAAGSYAITGTNAATRLGRKIAAGAGSYVVTGTDVTLDRTRLLAAAGGSYAISGTDAALNKGKTLAANGGSYAVSGTAASLLHDRLLAAAGGSYAITGTDAALNLGQRLTVDGGSYAVTGNAASLEHARKISAVGGSYVLTGTDTSLSHALKIIAAGGSYTISGSAADLLLDRLLAAAGSSYAITGAAADALRGLRIAANGGTYAITGAAAQALLDHVLTASGGSYAITGAAVDLTLGGGTPAAGTAQKWRVIGTRMGI